MQHKIKALLETVDTPANKSATLTGCINKTTLHYSLKPLPSLVLVDPIAVHAKRSCLSFKMRQTDGTHEYLALFLSLV